MAQPKSVDLISRRFRCSVGVLSILWAISALAQAQVSVSLAWDPSPDLDVDHYNLYMGAASGVYTSVTNISNATTATVANLTSGNTYYFSTTAVNSEGLESKPATELVYTANSASGLIGSVVGAYLFYNNSFWDGNDPAANANDDRAIATDKTPLLPGAVGSFRNYSSCSRGINGVMLDISSLPGSPAVSDFTFKAGNDNIPSAWTTAPLPATVAARPGAGTNGSTRITLIWPDQAIQKKWLQVTVLATANTGLAAPYVLYFGNAIGEVGNNPANANVLMSDAVQTLNNLDVGVGIEDKFDFNRDGKVLCSDAVICMNNLVAGTEALQLIDLTGGASLLSAPQTPAHLAKFRLLPAPVQDQPAFLPAAGPVGLLAVSRAESGNTFVRLGWDGATPAKVLWKANLNDTHWEAVPAEWLRTWGDQSVLLEIPSIESPSACFFRLEQR